MTQNQYGADFVFQVTGRSGVKEDSSRERLRTPSSTRCRVGWTEPSHGLGSWSDQPSQHGGPSPVNILGAKSKKAPSTIITDIMDRPGFEGSPFRSPFQKRKDTLYRAWVSGGVTLDNQPRPRQSTVGKTSERSSSSSFCPVGPST
jgi:hypothetical protein